MLWGKIAGYCKPGKGGCPVNREAAVASHRLIGFALGPGIGRNRRNRVRAAARSRKGLQASAAGYFSR